MPRYNHADQLSKNILRDALNRASTSETEVEVVAASQKIDVYAVPDPARAAERGQMGMLGWLSEEPSLFEPFSITPSLARVRRCLIKQLTWHHELERRARVAAGKAEEDADADPDAEAPPIVPFPWLVIISPGRPETVLEVYGCKEVRRGVYEAVAGFHMRVVVLAELRGERETLLLRMLGSGRLLGVALADLSGLPADAREHRIVTPLLLHFGLVCDGPPAANEEDDVSEEIRAWYEDYQRKQEKLRADALNEGRDEGRNEGRAEEAARALLTVLRARGITVPDAARERILAEKDPDRLEHWLEKAAVVASVAEVLGEPS